MNAALRAMALLVDPGAEWLQIEQETGDPAFLLSRYVAAVAAVPALFGFIGSSLVGAVVPGMGVVHAPLFNGLFGAIFGYAEAFITVLVLALIIDLLAPLFGGRRDFDGALKLAAYSYTPMWLAGIFLVLPGLRFLWLTGFYGIYLLATGLPRLMKPSEQRTTSYVIVIALCACALSYSAAAAQHAVFGTSAF